MGKLLWKSAVALLLASTASLAGAERPDVYLTGGVGVGHAPSGSLGGADATVNFDLGRPIGMLALGLDTPGRWRLELDGSYRYNDAEVVVFGNGGADLSPDSDSRITALSAMTNAVYELDSGLGIRPYLGAGVGQARIDYEITEYITGNRLLDDDDTTMAYQLIAGFGLPLTRHLDLLVDYRYWRAPDIELQAVDGGTLRTDHEVHSAMMSLRYAPFAVPSRAPAGAGPQGWYLRGSAGASFTKDAEIKNNIANFDAFDLGTTATLAVGRALGPRWRVELEGGRRSHEVELIDFNPEFGEDRADGRVRAQSIMANVLYEPGWGTAYRAYGGLGAGLAWSDWDVRLHADDSVYVDDEDHAAAVQVLFGAAARVSERVEVTAEFRYWLTGLFDMSQPDGRPMRTELAVSSLMLGVRYGLP